MSISSRRPKALPQLWLLMVTLSGFSPVTFATMLRARTGT